MPKWKPAEVTHTIQAFHESNRTVMFALAIEAESPQDKKRSGVAEDL